MIANLNEGGILRFGEIPPMVMEMYGAGSGYCFLWDGTLSVALNAIHEVRGIIELLARLWSTVQASEASAQSTPPITVQQILAGVGAQEPYGGLTSSYRTNNGALFRRCCIHKLTLTTRSMPRRLRTEIDPLTPGVGAPLAKGRTE